MAAGFRSPLALWAGGAAASVAQAGVRSPFAFWIGGATALSPTDAGVRSLLAFWAGGATTAVNAAPPIAGASASVVRARRRVLHVPLDLEDDDDLLLLMPTMRRL